MSGYENILKAMEQLKGTGITPNFANKGNNLSNIKTSGVNPYSSRAYTDFSYRDLASQSPEIFDERQAYSDLTSGLSGEDKLMLKGTKGLQGYSLGSELSPYLSKGLTNVTSAITGSPMSNAAMQSFNLGPAAGVYSAFGTDNNPYTFTKQEMYGGTASNLMAAHQLSKVLPAASKFAGGTAMKLGAGGVNPYVALAALAFSFWNNKRRKKKARRANEKVAREIGDEQTKQYDERQEIVQDYRDEQLARHNQQMHMDTQSQYSNQYGGNYSNRYMAAEGMKFSPQELNKIAKAGRNGDTMLAHINPQEAALLKSLGGSGTINPHTGLNEYGYGSALQSFGSAVTGGVGDVLGGVGDVISPIVTPIFNSAGNVVDTVGSNVVNPIVNTAGGIVTDTIDTAINTGIDTIQTAGDVASDAMTTVSHGINPILKPVMDTAMDITKPVMEGIHSVVEPIAGATLDVFGNVIEGTLDGVKTLGHDVLIPLVETVGKPVGDALQGGIDFIEDLFGGGGSEGATFATPENFKGYDSKRGAITQAPVRGSEQVMSNIKGSAPSIAGNKDKKTYIPGDWQGFKESEYLTENVLEETDYAAQGMKYKYYAGGKAEDIVAEFTGNELIVNDQAKVEKALESGNYRAAAAPIRRAMNNKQITPGPETHSGNPMPVDKEGNIYSHGGKLKFKVKKGAGVYDHATDQFKPTMTDREIAMTAYNNMEKWKSNGMA